MFRCLARKHENMQLTQPRDIKENEEKFSKLKLEA